MRPTKRRRGAGLTVGLVLVLATAPMALAASALPFTYTIAMIRAVRGRDMVSTNGNFCNTFQATHVDNILLDPNIWIELRKPPFDDLVGATVSYSNNGAAHVFCWKGFRAGETYFFKYFKRDNGKEVDGKGTVRDN